MKGSICACVSAPCRPSPAEGRNGPFLYRVQTKTWKSLCGGELARSCEPFGSNPIAQKRHFHPVYSCHLPAATMGVYFAVFSLFCQFHVPDFKLTRWPPIYGPNEFCVSLGDHTIKTSPVRCRWV